MTDDEQAERRRRTAALRSAERVLYRPSAGTGIGDQLAWLAKVAPGLHDLDEPTDRYGDGIVAALEARVAELLGKEAAAYFPTGTMAQQAALRSWAGRTGNATVALHPRAHPEEHESSAFSVVSGLRTVHPTDDPRMPTAAEVRACDEPFGTLMLELPLHECGFVLPTWEELTEVVAAARELGAKVHFDGARLWECTPHFGRGLAEIAGLADSVYVSFYKSLEGFAGAALAGPQSLIDEARVWRHRYGGNAFQQFPAVLSALAGLEHTLPRLPEYVAQAKVVAAGMREGFAAAGVGWALMRPEVPHTHQFKVWLPHDPAALNAAVTAMAQETKTAVFRGWWSESPGLAATEITVTEPGLAWTAADVAAAVTDFLARL